MKSQNNYDNEHDGSEGDVDAAYQRVGVINLSTIHCGHGTAISLFTYYSDIYKYCD